MHKKYNLKYKFDKKTNRLYFLKIKDSYRDKFSVKIKFKDGVNLSIESINCPEFRQINRKDFVLYIPGTDKEYDNNSIFIPKNATPYVLAALNSICKKEIILERL